MRTAGATLVVVMACLVFSGCGGAEEENRQPFKAGVASVKITPEKPGLYLAGWGENRVYTKVHDDLYARALALQRGDTTVVWVSLDLLGMLGPDVADVRRRVADVPPQNIVITCTHVHSAPDIIGFWGPKEGVSGVDEEYREFVKQRTAQAIKQAVRNLRTARIRLARTQAPPKTARNFNAPNLIDPEISIVHVVSPADEPIAVAVNWGCHPEALDKHNLEVTSDWVHWMRQVVEGKVGGICLFFNGALGGMVSPDISEHSFSEAERVGKAVGETVVRALADADSPSRPDLAFASRTVHLPVENERFLTALRSGLLPAYNGFTGREVSADLAIMWLGESVWMTMPGEPLPSVGLAAKALAKAEYKFFVSLANNELGYILPRDFWGDETYDYEWSMSVGPKTADLCLGALRDLLATRATTAKATTPTEQKATPAQAATKEKPRSGKSL
ncbi:MAG: hypothetical protein N2512_12265 [Armatimonadetes bacterium]|nr:hypothetical protein [Armatimonadota bacterium]